MNFLSHHEVAVRLYDQPSDRRLLFGSVLADLCRMSATRRLLPELKNPALIEGNVLHGMTNKVFDNHPRVLSLKRRLKDDLSEFLPWRTAIQSANAGIDIMFDGLWPNPHPARNELNETLRSALIDSETRAAFAAEPLYDLVAKLADNLPAYDEIEVVRYALTRTLSRTRTKLEGVNQHQLSSVLSRNQETLLGVGAVIMQQVVETLNTPGELNRRSALVEKHSQAEVTGLAR